MAGDLAKKFDTVRMVTYVPVEGETFGARREIAATVPGRSGFLKSLVNDLAAGKLTGLAYGESPGWTTVYVDDEEVCSVQKGEQTPIEIGQLADEICKATWPSYNHH